MLAGSASRPFPQAAGEPSRRWWQELRWITVLVVVAIIATLLWGLLGPEPRIVVSRETTVITEPLRADGLPDYETWFLEHAGRGTPPEDNAAVAILQATWPMGLEPPDLAEVCGALGIPDTPPDVTPLSLRALELDVRCSQELTAWLATRPPNPTWAETCELARTQPWRAEECPPLDAWLQRHATALDLARDGSARTTYAMPAACLLLDTAPPRPGPLRCDLAAVEAVANALSTRAMLHVAGDRPRDAWRDMHAVLRLVRLPARAGRDHVSDGLRFALSVCSEFAEPVLHVLGSPALSADDARTIGRDLGTLPPLPDMLSTVSFERVVTASFFTAFTRSSGAGRAGVLGLSVDDLPWEFRTSVDMNIVLRAMSDDYDRIETALRLPSRGERTSALDRLEAGARAAMLGPASWPGAAARRLRLATSRAARSEKIATYFSMALFFRYWLNESDETVAQVCLLRVAAALAEYRLRGLGGPDRPYPDTLDALVPDVLPAVPPDPFTGDPLRYERRDEGYLVYSVGTNGIDDGGTNRECANGEWRAAGELPANGSDPADIVVRMPRPTRSILQDR